MVNFEALRVWVKWPAPPRNPRIRACLTSLRVTTRRLGDVPRIAEQSESGESIWVVVVVAATFQCKIKT